MCVCVCFTKYDGVEKIDVFCYRNISKFGWYSEQWKSNIFRDIDYLLIFQNVSQWVSGQFCFLAQNVWEKIKTFSSVGTLSKNFEDGGRELDYRRQLGVEPP